MEEERDALRKEKEELMKRRDELEIELEYRALKGDFNPMKTKVLHLRYGIHSRDLVFNHRCIDIMGTVFIKIDPKW